MKRWALAVLAVVVVLGAACTTSSGVPIGGAGIPERPATDLSGWVRVATVSDAVLSPERQRRQEDTSPSGRYIAFATDDAIPPDADPNPSAPDLYLLDTDTDTYHHVPSLGEVNVPFDLRDDGTLLVGYRLTQSSPTNFALFTVGGGVVPLALPASVANCLAWSLPPTGGIDIGCSTEVATNRYPGLYHWEIGDASAAPVAVAGVLDGFWASVSANRRYVALKFLSGPGTGGRRVWDRVANAFLPHDFVPSFSLLPISATNITADNSLFSEETVGNDGRLLVTRSVWATVLQSYQSGRWDPHDGSVEFFGGFPPMSVARDFGLQSNYFEYTDWSGEIGRNYVVEGRPPRVSTILGDFSDPTARWRLPVGSWVRHVGADGTLVITSAATVNADDPSPGPAIYVRQGPLP